jgi:ribonuclease HI
LSASAATRRLKLFFDGGCRPNPGAMEAAVVAAGETYLFPDLGPGTSHQAEWLALLKALEVAETLGARDIVLVGDSSNVIGQAMGTFKPRSAPIEAYRARAARFDRVTLRHIGRKQNLAGIALERAPRPPTSAR